MRPSWLNSLVTTGVALIVSARADAQPLFQRAESLECLVANADLVFVARLVDFSGGRQADGPGPHDATIDVEEALKEPLFTAQPHRRMRLKLSYSAPVLADWKNHSRRLLVIVRENAPDETIVITPGQTGSEVLTADFECLREPEAMIRAAKEMVRRMPAPVKRLHAFGLAVPREAVAGTKWEGCYATGGCLILDAPVDSRLEQRAQAGIRSADYSTREEAARALRYFKSDENVARVKGLLTDPGWAYAYHAQENKGTEVRIYGVRQAAYRTLRSWGVDAVEPIIREEVRK